MGNRTILPSVNETDMSIQADPRVMRMTVGAVSSSSSAHAQVRKGGAACCGQVKAAVKQNIVADSSFACCIYASTSLFCSDSRQLQTLIGLVLPTKSCSLPPTMARHGMRRFSRGVASASVAEQGSTGAGDPGNGARHRPQGRGARGGQLWGTGAVKDI